MSKASFIELKDDAYKVMRLGDGRKGVLFKKGSVAKRYHRYMVRNKQEPTRLTKTKYGWAFKFGISTEDVMNLVSNDGVWPYSLLPPDFEQATQNMPKVKVFYQNSEWEWKGFDFKKREVNLLRTQVLSKTGTGVSLRHFRVPFPTDPSMTTGKDTVVKMWSVVSAGEPFTPTAQSEFIPYLMIDWKLNLNTGKWSSTEKNDYHLVRENEDFSEFLKTI